MYPVTLAGPRVTWREHTSADVERLIDMLARPEVFRYTIDDDVPELVRFREFLAALAERARRPERTEYKLGITRDGAHRGRGQGRDQRGGLPPRMRAWASRLIAIQNMGQIGQKNGVPLATQAAISSPDRAATIVACTTSGAAGRGLWAGPGGGSTGRSSTSGASSCRYRAA